MSPTLSRRENGAGSRALECAARCYVLLAELEESAAELAACDRRAVALLGGHRPQDALNFARSVRHVLETLWLLDANANAPFCVSEAAARLRVLVARAE